MPLRLEQLYTELAAAEQNGKYRRVLKTSDKKLAKKFGEEAIELVIEAARDKPRKLVKETADTLFYLTALLQAKKVPLEDVFEELEKRIESHADKT